MCGTLPAMFHRVFRRTPAAWWGVLVPISFGMAWLLTAVHLPAGVLLGCMLAGILLSSRDIQLDISPTLFALAQGVLGCLMAKSLQPAALAQVAAGWPIFLLVTTSIIAASAVLGWYLMRRQIFSGHHRRLGARARRSVGYGGDGRILWG